MMLDRLRRRIATMIAPAPKRATRAYAGARASRLTAGFGSSSNSSADTELAASLTQLRARSRQLMRDAPYAKRAKVIIVNNVVGSGVGLQAQVHNSRGGLHERVNAGIEEAWRLWARADSCHTGGALAFADLERLALSEIVTAGEVFIRKHPRAFGNSSIPFALELIEADRVADEFTHPHPAPTGNEVRMGVEVDAYGRPLAYWLRERHPGELRFLADQAAKLIRVPASEIIHLRIVDRWPQTRGEPWLHTVLRKLNDMDEYSGSELIAARGAANYFATLESPDADPMPGAEVQADGQRQINIEPLVIEQLSPGDHLEFHSPNRPNPALDPFLRYMLREVAAGVGVSYESLSRDYSQSNYSSSRLSLLDDRDLWRVIQQWWIRAFRDPLHREWMQQAVFSRAITAIPAESFGLNPEAFLAVRWKLRGWSWVDPSKEVDAAADAIDNNLTTVTDVLEQTGNGQDIEDYVEKVTRERDLFAANGLVHPLDKARPGQTPPPQAPAVDKDDDDGKTDAGKTDEDEGRGARVVNFTRGGNV